MLHRLWPYLAIIMFSTAILIGPAKAQTIGSAETGAAQEVIRDQLTAFQTREHDRAFSHAAPNIRSMFGDTERFIQMVKSGYAAIYNSRSFSFARTRSEAGVFFQEVIIVDPQGKEWQAIYSMQKQSDGSWKIRGVQMNPYSGATT